MQLNPLDRQQNEYIWAMGEWLKTEGLTAQEATMVRSLHTAAVQSLADFDMVRKIALGAFTSTLVSAVSKARAQGHMKEWPVA